MTHLKCYVVTQFSKSLSSKIVTIHQPRDERYKTEYGTYAQLPWWGEGGQRARGGGWGEKLEWPMRGKYTQMVSSGPLWVVGKMGNFHFLQKCCRGFPRTQ